MNVNSNLDIEAVGVEPDIVGLLLKFIGSCNDPVCGDKAGTISILVAGQVCLQDGRMLTETTTRLTARSMKAPLAVHLH